MCMANKFFFDKIEKDGWKLLPFNANLVKILWLATTTYIFKRGEIITNLSQKIILSNTGTLFRFMFAMLFCKIVLTIKCLNDASVHKYMVFL